MVRYQQGLGRKGEERRVPAEECSAAEKEERRGHGVRNRVDAGMQRSSPVVGWWLLDGNLREHDAQIHVHGHRDQGG
jgi:hypothetical protein